MQKPIRCILILALAGLTANGVRAQTLISEDINSTLVGSTTESDDNGTKVWTIVGGGADIWGGADGMRYAYMEATGMNWDYVVKVRDLQGPDGWSKAELMARDSYDGSGLFIQGGDRHISQMTTRAAGQNQVAAQWRPTVAGTSFWSADVGQPYELQRPTYPDTWLRVRREGTLFLTMVSSDGVNWALSSPIDTSDLDPAGFWRGTDPMDANVMAIGLAVTAHNDADAAGATAIFSDFMEHVSVPVAIGAQPPATIDMSANSTLVLAATATGDIAKTEWRKGGVLVPGTEIIGGGTIVNTYTVDLAQISDSGTYTLYVEGEANNVTSDACVVTITQDVTPPTMLSAIGTPTRTGVTITFSEPVKAPSATTAGNYTIAGLTVSNPVLSADERQVTLTTTAQAEDTIYTITVNNVQDGGGNPIAPNSTIDFNSAKFVTNLVSWERWNSAGGIDAFIDEYTAGTLGPPDVTWLTGLFESGRDLGDNYRGHGWTWFKAPTTGDYRFIMTVDDNARLFVSEDSEPANKLLTAAEGTWSNNREWANASEEQDSKTWSADLGGTYGAPGWPDFPIPLTADQTYYMEVFWQEGGGGDGVEVTYTLFDDAVPANGTVSALSGDLVGVNVDPNLLPPAITSPSGATGVTVENGADQTLSVVATAGKTYQWQWNGADIAGATSADYMIDNAIATDSGAYWCVVGNDNGSVTSPPYQVLVTATGVFTIEAEDFDYNSGQHMPEASTMPYVGGAYEGLSAVYGVDYMNDDNPANNTTGDPAHPVYRYGGDLDVADPAQNATVAVEQPGGQFAITRMGEWEMEANHKIGWVGAGNWGNYTRTFPTPAQTYWVFAGASQNTLNPGGIDGSLGLVTAGVGTASQTVDPLGNFTAPGTSAWSRNSLTALTDSAGAIATVEIGGLNTIRWNYNSGDSDYIVFVPATATPVGPMITGVTVVDGSITVTWTGGGEAEVTDDINGTWTPTGDTDGSFTATIQPGNAFLRVRLD